MIGKKSKKSAVQSGSPIRSRSSTTLSPPGQIKVLFFGGYTFHMPLTKSATLNRLLHCSLWQFSGALFYFWGLFFAFWGKIVLSPHVIFFLLPTHWFSHTVRALRGGMFGSQCGATSLRATDSAHHKWLSLKPSRHILVSTTSTKICIVYCFTYIVQCIFWVRCWIPTFDKNEESECTNVGERVGLQHTACATQYNRVLCSTTVLYKILFENSTNYSYTTVQPRLSGHIGTGTYPDKWFGWIWEIYICLNTASSVGLNTYYNVFTHCFCIGTNYRLYRMDRQWNKTEI